jgi:GT2 family glycosyltransferase
VLIPTVNGRRRLQAALESLERQTVDATVGVIDNGSRDGTAQILESRFPQVRLVQNQTNLGFGPAVNRAAAELHSGALVLVNDDVVCEPHFLERICAPLEHDGVGMVAGVLTQRDRQDRIDSAGIELDVTLRAWDYLWNRPVAALTPGVADPVGPCGGAAAYRLDAFWQVGGFDEQLFAYWEDTDLAIRLRDAGWRCALAPDARARHHRGATLGSVSHRQRELDAFGRAYVLAKHGDGRGRIARRLKGALLDWGPLLRQAALRRSLAAIRARRRGAATGRSHRAEPAGSRVLATVGFGEALRRQLDLLRLERSGRLPASHASSQPLEGPASGFVRLEDAL